MTVLLVRVSFLLRIAAKGGAGLAMTDFVETYEEVVRSVRVALLRDRPCVVTAPVAQAGRWPAEERDPYRLQRCRLRA